MHNRSRSERDVVIVSTESHYWGKDAGSVCNNRIQYHIKEMKKSGSGTHNFISERMFKWLICHISSSSEPLEITWTIILIFRFRFALDSDESKHIGGLGCESDYVRLSINSFLCNYPLPSNIQREVFAVLVVWHW